MNAVTSQNRQHLPQRHSQDDDQINISEMFSVVKAHIRFIIVVMLSVFVLAVIYAMRIPPRYQTSALIQIEQQQSSMTGLLNNLDTSSGGMGEFGMTATPVNIESALIMSRFIIQPTVKNLGLNIQVSPHYFPIFGSFMAHRYNKPGVAKPFLGLSKYAWGGESVKIGEFEVPDTAVGERFKLKVLTRNSYELYSLKGQRILAGKIGQLAESAASGSVPGMKLLVTSVKANPGLEYFIASTPTEGLVAQIISNLSISDLGTNKSSSELGYQVQTGVLNLSLKGSKPERLPLILNTIIKYEIQKNIEKKTAEAKKALVFLEKQSTSLKDELDRAETALTKYKANQGGIGVSAASQVLIGQMVDLEKSIFEIKLKKVELLQEYTEQHPYIIALNNQQKGLKYQLSSLEDQVKTLPKTEQNMLSLERDVKVKNVLYSLILSKIQQLQIVKEGTISDVRILDLATNVNRIPSKTMVILVGSLLFGFILAIGIILLKYIMVERLNDPDYIEDRLGLPMYAAIPHSSNQSQMMKDVKRHILKTGPFVLATLFNKDIAIESLRSLRTILLMTLQKSKNNVVTILGSGPNIGKSFVSINLAYVLADGGKNVLLLDADMRRGKMHTNLAHPANPGLAEILSGETIFEHAKTNINGKVFVNGGGVDFLPCGKYPANPAELLFDNAFAKFIIKVAPLYDIVLIDTPPVLAAADAGIIAKCATTNLLLIGARSGSIKTQEHTLKRLQKHDVEVQGLVLNNTKPSRGYGYGYGYEYYSDKPKGKKD